MNFFDDAFAKLPLLPQYKQAKNSQENSQCMEKYKERDPIQCEGKDVHVNGTCIYQVACKANMERIYKNTKQSIAYCKILTTKATCSEDEVYDIFTLGNLYAFLLENKLVN